MGLKDAMEEIGTEYPWAYRCDICEELVAAEEVRKHRDGHPQGIVRMTRVDL